MPRLPIPGSDEEQWGALLNDFLRAGHRADGATSQVAEVYNVRDFGARGDDATDDTRAIQAAIDAAQAARGGVVSFPVGVFRTTATLLLKSNAVVLQGAGNASIIKPAMPTGAAIRISHANDLFQCINNQVADLTLDRGVRPEPTAIGLTIEHARYTRVARLNVHNQGIGIAVGVPEMGGIPTQFVYIDQVFVSGGNFPDAGIRFFSGADYAVSRSFIEPSNRGIVMSGDANGIFIMQTSVINGNAYEFGIVSEGTGFARYLIGVNVENALQAQIHISGNPGTKRIVISSCWLGAGDLKGATRTGIRIEPGIENVVISECRIGDQRMYGIHSQGSRVRIAGNIIEANSTLGARRFDGIYLAGGSDVIVQSNLVHGPNHRYGIYTAGNLDNYIISENILRGNGSGGLLDTATGTHKLVGTNLQ